VFDCHPSWHGPAGLEFQHLRFRVPEDAHLATPTPNEFVAEDLCESLLSFLRDVSSIAACFDHVHCGDARESGLSIVHDDR
jgi:hypothetical protein